MSATWGVVRYEYVMAVRRWGVWLAFALASVPSLSSVRSIAVDPSFLGASGLQGWALAGLAALMMNLFLPVVGGIVMADRLARDSQLNVAELLRATPLGRGSYIIGKYAGVVLATLTPVLILSLVAIGVQIASGRPLAALGQGLLAFVGINLPAYLFVGAFAIACPAIMPVRVFQVLYTGYWFWGNFLSPHVMPTVADTVLSPAGKFVGSAFFAMGGNALGVRTTQVEAVVNLVMLAACAALALIVLERIMAWRESRA